MIKGIPTVSFHNFKSQNFKLSVSNPKNKYLAYLSVLSQISNCQGLGRKNKHEILKTDRSNPKAGASSRCPPPGSPCADGPGYYTYIYIYICVYTYTHVYIYIYIERER